MIDRNQLLEHAKAQQATDVHICAEAPILFRIGGELVPITKEKLTAEQSKEISLSMMSKEQIAKFEDNLDFDFMLAGENGRYRINIGYFDGAKNNRGTPPARHRQETGQHKKRSGPDNREHQPGQDHDDDGDDK